MSAARELGKDKMRQSFFAEKQLGLKSLKSGLSGVSLAALALLGITGSASAQDAEPSTDGFKSLNDIDGVQDVKTLADGSAEVTLSDGTVQAFSTSQVIIVDGQVFIAEYALEAVGLSAATGTTAGNAGIIVLGGLALAGVGIALAAGGGDDSAPAPAPTPTPTPTPNAAPVVTNAATFSVVENTTSAFTATATDSDAGDTLTFSLTGTDASLFAIDSSSGVVSFVGAPDFEMPGDAGADNVYDVTVNASDGTATATQAVAITVTDVNEAPVITNAAAVSAAENQTVAITAAATDSDGDALTFSLTGTDASLFAIDATTGVISFVGAPDFEMPGDAGANNVFDVIVNVSDGTATTTQNLAITVTNVNEAPVITSAAAISVAENSTNVTNVGSSDVDGDSLDFTLSGADAALFTIDAAGALDFVSPPDFETPGDANSDNVFNITITGTDPGGLTDSQAVAVTVTDVNEAPVITSAAAISVAENQTGALTAVATDVDAGDTLTFSLTGTDAALFAINASTGVISFVGAPDFEMPGDGGTNNVFDVVVNVSDGTATTTQAVAITVTDVNEAPVLTVAPTISAAENQIAVATASATDVDAGDTLTFSLTGTDAALFAVDAVTGVITFVAPPNFEMPGDAGINNVFDITVNVSDGTLTDSQAVAVTVTDVNDAPVITSAAIASIAENAANATMSAFTAIATDEDGDALTFSLTGADAGDLAIDPMTGVITFVTTPDFEMQLDADLSNDFAVMLNVSDGTTTTTQDFTFNVTNVNEAPVFSNTGPVSVQENQTDAGIATVSDPDITDAVTFSLTGADAGLFTIDSTGAISFITAPDFEMPTDTNMDNVFDIIVNANDGTLTTTQNAAVTVTNVNDALPMITSPLFEVVNENQTAVTTVSAMDVDGDALTFSLTGTDAALFAIDAMTGVVTFLTAPDFEMPGDAGGDGEFNAIVNVSDGTGTTMDNLTVQLFDVNEVPVITSAAAISVAENQTVVFTPTATDPDVVDMPMFSLSGTDAALFTVDPITNAITFIGAPDFETPGDAGADNVYDLTLTASDNGGLTDTQAITVTVTDVNEAPVITSAAAVSVAENQTAVQTAVASDVDAGDALTFSLSGTDAGLFAINATTGVITFNNAPDFEMPGDSGMNNVFNVDVTATDIAGLTDTQALAVTVTDISEPLSVLNFNQPENVLTGQIFNLTAANTTITTTIAGPDAASIDLFANAALAGIGASTSSVSGINSSSPIVALSSIPDFENPTDVNGDGVFEFNLVVVTNPFIGPASTQIQPVTFTITDVGGLSAKPSAPDAALDSFSVVENDVVDLNGETSSTVSVEEIYEAIASGPAEADVSAESIESAMEIEFVADLLAVNDSAMIVDG